MNASILPRFPPQQPPPSSEQGFGLPVHLREGIIKMKRLRRSRDPLVAERAQADRVSAARCLAFLYRSVQITITSPSPSGGARRPDGGELKQLIEITRQASNELFEAVDPADKEDAKELLGPLMAALFCASDAHSPRLSRPLPGRPPAYRYEALSRMLFVFTSEADIGKEVGLDRRLGLSTRKKTGLLSASKMNWKHDAAYGAHLIALGQLLTGMHKAEEIVRTQEVVGSARLLFDDDLADMAASGAGADADAAAGHAGVLRAQLAQDPVDVAFDGDVIRDIETNREEKRRKMAEWGRRACQEVLKTAMRK